MRGKPWGAPLLNLFSNCEWVWTHEEACFFATPGGCVAAVLGLLLSMFGRERERQRERERESARAAAEQRERERELGTEVPMWTITGKQCW